MSMDFTEIVNPPLDNTENHALLTMRLSKDLMVRKGCHSFYGPQKNFHIHPLTIQKAMLYLAYICNKEYPYVRKGGQYV